MIFFKHFLFWLAYLIIFTWSEDQPDMWKVIGIVVSFMMAFTHIFMIIKDIQDNQFSN